MNSFSEHLGLTYELLLISEVGFYRDEVKDFFSVFFNFK